MALPYRTTGSQYLLDLWVSQLSALLPLYSTRDFRPRAHLRTPPFLRGGPPQSNYPPDTVLVPDHGTELEPQHYQGGISRTAPLELAFQLQSSHLSTSKVKVQCQAAKVHGSFRLAAGTLHLHSDFDFTEPLLETAPPSLCHSCRSELTRQGISLP